ncbi:MAG: prolyl hydroxylase family protein, partial [Campylobacterota bacterium]
CDHELFAISQNLYAPISWLDTLIPPRLKMLTNPYKETPYYYFDAGGVESMYDFATDKKDAADKIGIISTKGGPAVARKETNIRNTYNILPSAAFMQAYNALFARHKEDIQRYFNLSITYSGDPQILIYTPGCFYIRHSDNCAEILKDGKLTGFKPVAPQRVLTTVLFLNGDFTGGELVFDFFCDKEGNPVTIAPQAGKMISFFSNPYYSHSVRSVTQGTRISVAQWHRAVLH